MRYFLKSAFIQVYINSKGYNNEMTMHQSGLNSMCLQQFKRDATLSYLAIHGLQPYNGFLFCEEFPFVSTL